MKYTKKSITYFTGLIIAGLMTAGAANAADTTTTGSALSSKGSSFVKEASSGNLAEIATAQLAQQKAQNPEIKSLAQMIQQDHQQAQEKLQTIAQAHGLALEQNPSWSQKRAQSKLEKLNGADFDQQYAKDMLEDHVTDIKKFQKASQQVEDTDVKQYAQDTLPTLQKHLEHAETAAKSAGVDSATISSITKNMPGSVGGTGDNQESGHGVGEQKP
jgi:putative membrane protein